MKRLLKILRNFLLIILLLIVGSGVFFYFNYKKNRIEPADILPADFLVYLRLSSTSDLVERLSEMSIVEEYLKKMGEPELLDSLIDLRSLSGTKQKIARELLDMPVSLLMKEYQFPYMIVDLGWRGELMRLLPFVNSLYRIESLNLVIHQRGKNIFYEYDTGAITLFFTQKNNLLIASIDIDTLDRLFDPEQPRLSSRTDMPVSSKPEEIIDVFVHPAAIPWSSLNLAKEDRDFLDHFTYPAPSRFSIDPSDTILGIRGEVPWETSEEKIINVLNANAEEPNSLKVIPDSVTLYTSFKFGDLEDFISLIMLGAGGRFDSYLKLADTGAGLLGVSIEDIYNWIGDEAGLFMLPGREDPLAFIKINNEKAFDKFIQKLASTLFLKENSRSEVGGVVVRQIKPSPFSQFILDILGNDFETPSFAFIDGYLFIGASAEGISHLALERENSSPLKSGEVFKSLSQKVKKSHGYIYYNYSDYEGRHASYFSNNIIKHYTAGFFALNYSPEGISIDARIHAIPGGKPILFSGFPIDSDRLSSAPLLYLRANSRHIVVSTETPEILFIDSTGSLRETIPLEEGGEISVFGKELFLFTRSGELSRYTDKAQFTPVATGYPSPLFPTIADGSFFFYDSNASQIVKTTQKGDNPMIMTESIRQPLFSPPAYFNGNLYYYPRNLLGEVFAVDSSGNTLNGWPKRSNGISDDHPRIVTAGKGNSVYFMNRKGELYRWNTLGEDGDDAPYIETGKAQAIPPAYMKTPSGVWLLTTDRNGWITLWNLESKGIIIRRKLDIPVDDEARWLAQDINNDGWDEAFLYNNGNHLFAVDKSLTTLKGFPLTGRSLPSFGDINRDKKVDMVTSGVDDKIYLYTIQSGE